MLAVLLPRLPAPALSETARRLTRTLLLTAAVIPAAHPSNVDLLAAKIDRLWSAGDASGLAALAPLITNPDQLSTQTRDQVLAGLFATGEPVRACPVATAWAAFAGSLAERGVALCQALQGNRPGTDLALDLIGDRKHGDAAFEALIRALIGGDRPDGSSVDVTDSLSVLAALRLKLLLPPRAFDHPTLLVAPLLTMARGNLVRRAALAERMEHLGLLQTKAVADAYDALANASKARAAKVPADGVSERARLYRDVIDASGPAVQAQAIVTFAEAMGQAGLGGVAARLMHGRIVNLTQGSLRPSVVVSLARAVAAGGDLRTLRTLAEAVLPLGDVGRAIDRLWLLEVIAGPTNGGPPPGAARYALALGHGPGARRRLALAGALLAGVGCRVPAAFIPVEDEGRAPPGLATGIEAGLDGALAAGRSGAALLIVLAMLGDKPLAEITPPVAEAAVRALIRLGLEHDARTLAVEIALGAGL